MTVARLNRLSSTSSVSATMTMASGRSRSSGGASGRRLDGADDVVAEVADRATGEARQAGHHDRRVAPHGAPEVLERREVGLDRAPPVARASTARTRDPGSGTPPGARWPGRCSAPSARLPRATRGGSRSVRGAAWRRPSPGCRRRARPGGSPAPSRRPAGPARRSASKPGAHGRRRHQVGARPRAAAPGARPGRDGSRGAGRAGLSGCRTWPTASARS